MREACVARKNGNGARSEVETSTRFIASNRSDPRGRAGSLITMPDAGSGPWRHLRGGASFPPLAYYRSDRTSWLIWLACLSIEPPACCRMFSLVMFAVSLA